jgi:hypothetical protein
MSFLLSFFKWTVFLTQVIWTKTDVDVPVFSDLEDYIEIPEATLYINGKAIYDKPTYMRDGVNRTFLSTVVTSYCKTYYIYYEAYFEDYNIQHKQLIKFNVVDQVSPEITYIPTYSVDVFGEPPDFRQNLKYRDNYDDQADLDILIDDGIVDYDRVGSYDVFYLITDLSGNVNEYTGKVHIIDRKPPVIENVKPLKIEVNQLLDIHQFLKIYDNYDLNVQVDVISDEDSFDRLGYFEITVVALDSSKNSTEMTYILEVVDQTPPELILVSYPEPLHVYDTFKEEDCYRYVISLIDNYDDLDISDIKVVYDIDMNRVGEYLIYYEISDDSGNITEQTLEVEVKDLVGPEIIIDTTLNFEVFSQEPLLSELFIVSDNYCSLSTIDIKTDFNLNMDQIGRYPFTITATDCYKNKTTVNTMIEIIDSIGPKITQVSEIILTEFIYKDLSIYFNAIDAYDHENTIITVDDSQVNYEMIGTYEIHVYAEDLSHNQSVITSEVLIIDTEPPVLILKEDTLWIHLNQTQIDFFDYIDQVEDNYTKLFMNDIEISSNINFNQLGRYEVRYQVIDQSYNQTTVILEVIIIDQEPPTISGSTLYKNMFDSIDVMEGIETSDNVGVYKVYTSTKLLDTSYPGSYEVTYIAVDTSGNRTTYSRMIYISEADQPYEIEDFIPIIIILFISFSTLYYLYKKL